MKYLKTYHEALKPSQFRKYVKEFDRDRYSEIFKEIGDKYDHDKNYYRVYIPLEKKKLTGYISDTHKEVDNFLKENDCQIIDYVKGKAKFNNSKNETTIGKLLTRLKNDKLNIAFQSDEKRKVLTSTEKEDLLVVISRHPYDIAGSDTDRNWTNCMTIGTDKSNRLTKLMDEYEKTGDKEIKKKINDYKENGENVKYLIHEVKEGSLISYLIKSDDKNISNPLAVLNIKPYVKDEEFMLSTSKNMYGVKRPEFKNTVDNILSEYFNKSIKPGAYFINQNVYNDGDSDRINYNVLYKELKEFCENSLANLLDEGYEIDVISDNWGFNQCLLKSTTNNLFYWNDVKNDYIPFLQLLSENYEIDNFLDDKLKQVSFSGNRYSKIETMINDEIDNISTYGINIKVVDKKR